MYKMKIADDRAFEATSSSMIIALSASVISTLLYFLIGISSRALVIINDFNTLHYVAMGFILIFPYLSLYIPERFKLAGFYMKSVSLLMFLGLSLAAVHSLSVFAISLAPLLLYSYLWLATSVKLKLELKKLLTFSLAMLFMYLAGSLFHLVVEPSFYPSTFASVGEAYVFDPNGVPFLLKGGIAFITPYVQGIVSPLSFLVFTAISAILTENYFGIFSLLRRGKGETRASGAAYGAVSLLSCQCEGGISLLPTMAYLVITIAMIPILTESFLLLLLTNVLINRFYLNGNKLKVLSRISNPRSQLVGFGIAAVLFLATPIIETVGIYFGLITNIFFFFGIGILMTISSYYEVVFIGRLLGYGKRLPSVFLAALFVAASILMFVWYIPHYTVMAVENVSVFLMMNVTGILAGFFFGLIKLSSRKSTGQLLEEFIALMFGMPPIIVFYISALLQVQFWPVFNITQQIEFGLIMWAIILPFMWLTTNISLNDARDNFEITRAVLSP